jgi:hypothetical protein
MNFTDFVGRGRKAQEAIDAFAASGTALTADDKKRLLEIHETTDPEQLAGRLFDYYHDANRADRTSRSQMYLHMGMLTGAVMRVLEVRGRQ